MNRLNQTFYHRFLPSPFGSASQLFLKSVHPLHRVRSGEITFPPSSVPYSAAPIALLFSSGDDGSPRVANVPLTLQLQWEMQGVSGRAYQRDGDPSLYRKKVDLESMWCGCHLVAGCTKEPEENHMWYAHCLRRVLPPYTYLLAVARVGCLKRSGRYAFKSD